MSSKVISITSTAHFKQTLSSSTYVVADFYADWCGPCKVISPVFEQLAAQESKPGRIVFCKVDVDHQRDVAQIYGISAMPTFLVLKGSKVVETVRGANPTALRSAILSAAADAAKGPARSGSSATGGGGGGGGALFSGKGQTLGGGGGGPAAGGSRAASMLPNLGRLLTAPASVAAGSGVLARVVRFVGLYLSTLLSFDPLRTAEDSPFAVRKNNVKTR